MAYVITEPCIGTKDRACVDVCPVDCIYEGEDQLYIHPDECIDCGACIPVCPVHAIVEEFDLPDDQQHWIEINAKSSKRYPVVRTRLPALETAAPKRAALGY